MTTPVTITQATTTARRWQRQPRQETLDILTHVTRLGKHRGVNDCEGHMEHPCDGTGQQGLARAGLPDQDDVRFFYLNIFTVSLLHQPLVVVVYSYREYFLCPVLPDDVLIEECLYLIRLAEL